MNLRSVRMAITITMLVMVLPLSAEEDPGFEDTINTIQKLFDTHLYSDVALDSPGFQRMQLALQELGATAENQRAFISGFNALWADGPFSHVRLTQAEQPAEQIAAFLDNMSVGEQAVQLRWEDQIAILTINTMMGVDTIDAIVSAYQSIAQRQTDALIIDLRQNEGGAFAVKPLISHVIDTPLDTGVFLSRKWRNKQPPTRDDTHSAAPWEGWSIRAFWSDVTHQPLTRIQVQPTLPHYHGPIWVLVSSKTASAAELATDALANLDNVTTVGESTAGQMLSQKMFDVPPDLHLYLPVADYYSHRIGKIEGQGVRPDIEVSADQALQAAIAEIRESN